MQHNSTLLSDSEEADLTNLVQDIIDREMAPLVASHESTGTFPRDIFRTLGASGLLSLPYPEEYGGGNLPYANYLSVLEQLGGAWASIAVGVSVHSLSCHPMAYFGTDDQRQTFLPHMLSGDTLGAYCLSEAHAGSDPRAMLTTATQRDGGYVIKGTKTWITHGGEADFYIVFAATDLEQRSISCFYVPAEAPGISADAPERKMGLRASRTSAVHFDDVWVPTSHRIGVEGGGLQIALSALDAGRLGIAAVATGVAQAALTVATDYARSRVTFSRPIIDHQSISFLLADMATNVEVSRVMYERGASLKDQGLRHTKEAAMAKLVATDHAMDVTTDAVQVLGGAGYIEDFPVERFMREAKIMQIFEGTNQIQRLVISRHL